MADMTFKVNLLPESDLGYSLGSSNLKWQINGGYPFVTYYNNIDYSATAMTAGAYTLNGQTHPVTNTTEYGSALTLPARSSSAVDGYNAQLIISSASGQASATHAYIRRLTTAGWSDWSTLLDDKNYSTYLDERYVNISGDTMTGSLGIKTESPYITLKHTPAGTDARLNLTWASSNNQGLWSSGYYDGTTYTSSSLWLIYRGSDGNVTMNGHATSATYVTSYLASRATVSGNTHAAALQTYFTNNSSTIPRNCLQTYYSSAYGNGSQCFGYWLSGYNSNPYGGFFVAHYNTPKYVGIQNGTYTEKILLAATSAGTADTQALVSNGANADPKWVNISPSITITAGTASATPKVNVTVLGQSGTAQALTTATTGVYGCTKLTSSYTASDSTLAATGASIAAAIGGLDVAAVGGGTGEYISKIQETDGKISATKSTTSVSNTWTGGTTAGPTIKTTVNGITGTAVAIPTATASASGVVTTGDQTWAGSKTFNGTVICAKTTDAAGTTDNKPALIVGGASTAAHIEIDNNEILAKSNGTTPATLYLQDTTGIVSVAGSGGFNVTNSVSTFSKNVVIQSNGILNCYRTTTGRFMEMFSNSQSVGYWRNETLGTTSVKGWADIIIGNSLADTADKNAHGRIFLGANGGWASYTGETGALGGTNRHYVNFGYIKATQAWGAVWNDYAEFRETKGEIEPGRCIREVGDDTLILTTERLQKGCEIVSDTYGFAIGESPTNKTPTAASGRVLAYLYENREIAKQHIGDPVCSGPNGTVSIMTEEEEMKYPSRIIGTISSVPDYEIWYAGSEEFLEEIKVNGRVWIRIR